MAWSRHLASPFLEAMVPALDGPAIDGREPASTFRSRVFPAWRERAVVVPVHGGPAGYVPSGVEIVGAIWPRVKVTVVSGLDQPNISIIS